MPPIDNPEPMLRHISDYDEIDCPLQGGEAPYWDEQEQALYFVDMHAPALLRLDPTTGKLNRWTMPDTIGSFGLCLDGRAIVSLRSGLHFFDLATERLELIAHPEAGRPENRLNDGKVGPDGRFWVGSMNESTVRRPEGSLYRVDHDGTCLRILEGLYTSNGLAWSPNGRLLYHSDSRGKFVQVFDYNLESGSIANGRTLCTMTEQEGRPDGAAMDCEGFYWSAGVSAGCLNRLSPDGRIVEKIILPVAAPSMPCFGGADLKTLYVTSLTSDPLGQAEPGRLISFRVDIAGTPGTRFGRR